MKRSALKRYTALRPRSKKKKPEVRVGKVTGKVRLSGLAMERLRERAYRRDRGRCNGCGKWLPLYGSVFNRAHFAHCRSRGASGSDSEDNGRILCFSCHDREHSTGIKAEDRK